MDVKLKENLINIFKSHPEVKLAYFFGSKAKNNGGPLSDYDFAVYFDESDKRKMYDVKFKLLDELSRFLKTDKVDVVILNLTESSELKYNIIKDGIALVEEEPFKVILEPKIFNEYFDFRLMLLKHKLTKA